MLSVSTPPNKLVRAIERRNPATYKQAENREAADFPVKSAGLGYSVLRPPYGLDCLVYLGLVEIDDIGAVESLTDYESRGTYSKDVLPLRLPVRCRQKVPNKANSTANQRTD